jgi:hypothetical protein
MITWTALINAILAVHVCKFQFKKCVWDGDEDHETEKKKYGRIG